MGLFDDLPEPVAEFKSLKRRIDDEGNNGGCSAGKKSLIELIDLLVGTAAEKGERDEMQDEHLSIPDFGDKVAAGAYSGSESVSSEFLMVMVVLGLLNLQNNGSQSN